MNIGLLHVLVYGLLFLDIQGDPLADKAPESLTVAIWNLEWFFDNIKEDNRSGVAKEQSAPSREEWEWKLYTTDAGIAKFQPTILAVQEIEDHPVMATFEFRK